MKISILCVGKVKEKFFRMAVDEYVKRLSRYCKLEIIEVADEKTAENASEHEVALIKDKEGERLSKYIRPEGMLVVLEIQGKMFSSEELSEKIQQSGIHGESHIQFVIGGSLGLSDKILNKADILLSFSKMTFPHQLMRVILLEQIYRSYRIMNNEPYHK